MVAGAGGTHASEASTHTNLLRVTTGALVVAGLLGPLLLAYMVVALFWRDLARTWPGPRCRVPWMRSLLAPESLGRSGSAWGGCDWLGIYGSSRNARRAVYQRRFR